MTPTVVGMKNNINKLSRNPAPLSIHFTGIILKHKQVNSNKSPIILPGMTKWKKF